MKSWSKFPSCLQKFFPSILFSLPKNSKITPEKPPALPSPWYTNEESVFGSALYAYVARLGRRRPKPFVFSVCVDYTNDLDDT